MKKTAKSLLCVLVLLLYNNVFTQNIKIYVTPPITNPTTGVKITPYSGISPAYHSNKIFITASSGEYEPASFTIKTLDGIPDLVIEPTSLIGTNENIPAANIDIKVVKCWHQATDGDIDLYSDGNVLTPELLLNNDNLVYIYSTDNWLHMPTGRQESH